MPVNAIGVIESPEHMICVVGFAIAFGVGFTNTMAVMAVPEHPFAVGVIVKVTVTGAFVVLVKIPLMLPLPFDGMPVTVAELSRVQL